MFNNVNRRNGDEVDTYDRPEKKKKKNPEDMKARFSSNIE